MKKRHFNPNTMGVVILIIAFGFSVLRYRAIREQLNLGAEKEGARTTNVVRVLHWQLEPGYREALQWAMDEYNALPHVKEAGVKVIQLAIPERVYSQFLNVHLISGTAPDICVKGMSSMVGDSSATARFFDPISEFVGGPNPYNQKEYLKPGISDELATFLQTAAWSDTFSDGMAAGWDAANQDYYAVPISSWGTVRVFYNKTLVKAIKEMMRRDWALEEAPEWKRKSLEDLNYLKEDDALLAWIETDQPPESLGRFLLFCEAALAYAAELNLDKMVPISASSYRAGQFYSAYQLPFTANIAKRNNFDHGNGISTEEIYGGWQAGKWSYEDPEFKAFFEVAYAFTPFFPAGFMGLDREQAQRRFVLGNAVFLATGAWDANSIFIGAKRKADPADQFDVGVMRFPMPEAGERWFEHYAGQGGGGGSNLGVPMAISKQSPNKQWAVDFLQYVTSHRVNEKFNSIASWLPAILGAEPVEQMKPFQPELEGLVPSIQMHMNGGGQLTTLLTGQFLLYFSGDLSYEGFVEAVRPLFENERYGVNRIWIDREVGAQDRARQLDRALDVRIIEDESVGSGPLGKAANLLENSLLSREGLGPRILHHTLFPETSFPTY